MSNPKISICLATFNEEKNIKRCLSSVMDLADEIIIVDGSSSDKTVEIARQFGAKVTVTTNKLMFHKNKQMAIDKASKEWILLLDADEEVTKELQEEITEALNSPISGFWIPRKNIIFGKWIKHTGWWPDCQLRLFRKGKVEFSCQSVHEQPILKGQSENLKNPLTHHHYQTISQFLKRLDLYTENDKRVHLKKNKKFRWQDALIVPVDEFIKRFIVWKGYKDGIHGLILSLLQSFYQLIVFAKVWEAGKFGEKEVDQNMVEKIFKKGLRDYKWWRMESKVKSQKSKVKKIYYKFLRKIRAG